MAEIDEETRLALLALHKPRPKEERAIAHIREQLQAYADLLEALDTLVVLPGFKDAFVAAWNCSTTGQQLAAALISRAAKESHG